MTVQVESAERFFRPADAERVRRNYRRIQMHRLLAVLRGAVVLTVLIAAATALYRRTQSDARFAVQHVEIIGLTHTSRSEVQSVTQRYVGLNLFHLDIARLRHDLGALPWVSRIEIEKKLPDTLRIRVVERTPVALAEMGDRIAYVDEWGVPFAELAPSVGDSDWPLITAAQGTELARCVAMLRRLQVTDRELYARLSEVRPLPPRGFAFFDRELQAFVYANEEDLSSKWRSLHAIARAERLNRGEIAYADLRFSGRVVVKPLRAMPAAAIAPHAVIPSQITN